MAEKAGLFGEKKQATWDDAIKALAKNPGPKAQALYNRISKSYNLKVESINQEKGNQTMSDNQNGVVETPTPVETPVETPNETQVS